MNVTQLNQEAIPVAVGVTYMAYLTAIPPEAVLGAFTGSVIFLLGAKGKSRWLWLLYFVVAFFSGLLGGHTVAGIATQGLGIIRINADVPEGFGALLAAACTINTLGWFRDNPAFFWTRKQGNQAP